VIQVVTLVLALIVVLKRPRDPVALIGGLLLATIGVFKIVRPWRIAAVWRDLPPVIGALLWLPHVSDVAAGAIFFTFVASFPRRMIRSFGVWLLLWLPMAIALVKPLQFAIDMVYAPDRATGSAYQGQIVTVVTALYVAAAIAALTINYSKLTDVNERRRQGSGDRRRRRPRARFHRRRRVLAAVEYQRGGIDLRLARHRDRHAEPAVLVAGQMVSGTADSRSRRERG